MVICSVSLFNINIYLPDKEKRANLQRNCNELIAVNNKKSNSMLRIRHRRILKGYALFYADHSWPTVKF